MRARRARAARAHVLFLCWALLVVLLDVLLAFAAGACWLLRPVLTQAGEKYCYLLLVAGRGCLLAAQVEGHLPLIRMHHLRNMFVCVGCTLLGWRNQIIYIANVDLCSVVSLVQSTAGVCTLGLGPFLFLLLPF